MPRIDPAAVLAACRARPECRVVRGQYGDGQTCGCPLTLFSMSLGKWRSDGIIASLIRAGYDIDYLLDFTRGVDNCCKPHYSEEGFWDGTATRELLVREGVMT